MVNQRVLVVDDSTQQRRPTSPSAGTGCRDLITVNDPIFAVAEAVAQRPDFVVLGVAHDEALNICRQIMDYLPSERHPTFVICGRNRRPDNTRNSVTPQQRSSVDDANEIRTDDNELINRISFHGLEMDRSKMRASIQGQELGLTGKEFSIIWTLAARPGHVHTRKQLLDGSSKNRSSVGQRTVDQHVRSIRRKLGHHSYLIETVRGLGYRFRDCDGVKIVNGCVQGE